VVEVLGRYSHHPEQGERVRTVLEMFPNGDPKVKLRTKQVQHRLRPTEVEELVSAYRAGTNVRELSAKFNVHRSTITNLMKRHGVRLRYPAFLPDELEEVISLYRSGHSVAAVGRHFGVNARTAWMYLSRENVQMRNTNGQCR